MLTSVNINNRQNERPFVCFHDMFGKKNTQPPRRRTVTVISILKPGPSLTSVSVISLGMQQASHFFILQWKRNALKILTVSC